MRLRAIAFGPSMAQQPELKRALEDAGYDVELVLSGAWNLDAAEPCHLGIIEESEPGQLKSILAEARKHCPEAALVALIKGGQLALAVEAMKLGASACLTLPVLPERLRATAESFKHAVSLEAQVARLRLELKRRKSIESIVGQSPALLRCIELARLVAGYPMNVLLNGESGSGKESMATLIHDCSGRGDGPFIAVDCGTLTEELADDELFGHKKGAFTGADSDRQGRLQEACGGTLFLDEIGNLPMAQQAKLLRVLQAREIWPLGATASVAVDLRIVAATHEDLPALVKAGRFRLDLYHRLNEFSLRVPALRERPDDIEALALFFVHQLCQRFGRESLAFDASAMAVLRSCVWPGNIRQLQNALKHACIVAKGSIKVSDLPPELNEARTTVSVEQAPDGGPLFSEPTGLLTLWQAETRVVEEVERRMISEAMVLCRGDCATAAKSLGLHPKTLARKLKSYGLAGIVGAVLTD